MHAVIQCDGRTVRRCAGVGAPVVHSMGNCKTLPEASKVKEAVPGFPQRYTAAISGLCDGLDKRYSLYIKIL